MSMFGMIKLIGRCLITGAAVSAGHSLWNDVLDEKVRKMSSKLKRKMEEKKK